MAHLSNPQTQRTLRFVTLAACTGAGITSVFFSKFEEIEGFEGKEHIFTHIQKDARDFVDRSIFGIDPDLIQKEQQYQRQQQQNQSKLLTAETTKPSLSKDVAPDE